MQVCLYRTESAHRKNSKRLNVEWFATSSKTVLQSECFNGNFANTKTCNYTLCAKEQMNKVTMKMRKKEKTNRKSHSTDGNSDTCYERPTISKQRQKEEPQQQFNKITVVSLLHVGGKREREIVRGQMCETYERFWRPIKRNILINFETINNNCMSQKT